MSQRPLEIVGDEQAPSCTDGVCDVPVTHPTEAVPAD